MSSEEPQLIKIDNEYVFLVLTEQTGSDFTFYLQDDVIVRQLLRQESGEIDDFDKPQPNSSEQAGAIKGGAQADDQSVSTETRQPKKEAPKIKYDYSCRVHILKPLLDARDLKKDESNTAIFLRGFLDYKKGKSVARSYLPFKKELPETFSRLRADNLKDEKLIGTLIKELNGLLNSDLPQKPFKDWEIPTQGQRLLNHFADEIVKKIISNRIKLCDAFRPAIKQLEVKAGRVLAARSYEDKVWAFSFREQESKPGYKPSADVGDNLNSIEEICHALYEEIFYAVWRSEAAGGNDEEGRDEHRPGKNSYRGIMAKNRKEKLDEISGLVVVAGATNSAKSLITRGLIHLYLENVKIENDFRRRPHLVTFEDPIEKYFAEDTYTLRGAHSQADVVMSAFYDKVDYTPRQRAVDVKNLQEALRGALRQTPKVFFVGETRDRKDWRALIDFASTGHIVVTTAHAGSLLEAVHKIFLATGAKTPAARGEVAGRLLAVVHLKRMEIKDCECGVLVPAVWRRVPRGLNALTAEGLASILPHSHSEAENPCSCLGRKYFIRKLLELAVNRRPHEDEDFKRKLRFQATDWDLQGA
jgi:hypothetical protein